MNLFQLAKLRRESIISLSKSQKDALMKILFGYNILINGEPGTGKTHLVKMLTSLLYLVGKEVNLTSTTGSGAKNLGGRTISSLLRLGLYDLDDEEIIERNTNNPAIKETDVLVIDEASFLNLDQFRQIDIALKSAKGNHRPFGNVQIILVGDDCQMECLEGEPVLRNEISGFKKVTLLENFRQKDDPYFVTILKQMRREVIQGKSKISKELQDEILKYTSTEPKMGSLITPRYQIAQEVNEKMIASLSGETFIYESVIGGEIPEYELQEFKVGMQVMHTVNSRGLVNGDVGVILEVDQENETILVDFGHDSRWIEVFVSERTIKTLSHYERIGKERKAIYVKKTHTSLFIPLIPCYALTTRKAQGLTLSSGKIHSAIFEESDPRVRYTALSRFRELKNIYISHM